ncbi:MAG TPA: family 16 glycoside hydrolase [Lacipirellulaceae bacterium]|nr:family 16 glycoside hydrolase [Lacipirellulaceae bacterium]
MRAALIAILLLISTSDALADIVMAKGTVESVDAESRTITVRRKTASGEKTGSFEVAADAELISGDAAIELNSLKEGDAVTLTYDTAAKHLTKIERIAADEPNKSEELFNGRDLTGWGLKKPKTGGLDSMWVVDPERKVLISPGGNGSNWLESDNSYNDFVLSLDYRFPPGGQVGGNGSGVAVRSAGFTRSGFDPRGIEVELQPNVSEQGSGTLICYECSLKSDNGEVPVGAPIGKLVPTKFVQKPAGQWNKLEVEGVGDRISVKINDELVNEGTGTKILAGRISLRNQSTAIELRNIRLLRLPLDGKPSPSKPKAKKKPKEEVAVTFSALSLTIDADGSGKLIVDSRESADSETEQRRKPIKVKALGDVEVFSEPEGRLRMVYDFSKFKALDQLKSAGLSPDDAILFQQISIDSDEKALVLDPGSLGKVRWRMPRTVKGPLDMRLTLVGGSEGLPELLLGNMEGALIVSLHGNNSPENEAAGTVLVNLKIGKKLTLLVRATQPAGQKKEFEFKLKPEWTQQSTTVFVAYQGEVPIAIPRLELAAEFMPFFGISLTKRGKRVVVDKVFDGSAGAAAGIKAGDTILAINGEASDDVPTALELLGESPLDKDAVIRIERLGKKRTINVTPK